MSGNGGNLHSLRDLPGTYEKSGLVLCMIFKGHNAEVTGAGAQRREPKAVRFWRPVDRLVNGRSPPWLSLETQTACPLPDSLHQLDGWRKEPERKGYPPDYRLRRTAPQLGHAMNTNTADYCGNQTRQRIFRPWRSLE